MLFAKALLRGPDYALLIGYFLLMLGIGFYFYRFMRGMKMYFSGGNKIPWWLSGISFYMTSFSAFFFVAYSGLAYEYGWLGVTLIWVTVPATIFSVTLFARRWRRARIDSPLTYLQTRYSEPLRQLFVWEGVPLRILDDSLKMVATGTFLQMGMGLDPVTSILASGAIILGYTFMGGLWAVTVTDFVQFVVLFAAILIVFPLALDRVGGFAAFVDRAPAGFFDMTRPEKGYGWIYVVLTVLLYCVAYSSTNWSLIQKYYCVPTEKDTQKAGWLVVVLNLVGFPIMLFPAMAAPQFLEPIANNKEVYPTICAALLPVGMLGLVIAAMFAATMSTLSSDFNVCASVLTNDVYRRFIRPHASEKETVFVGRVMTLLVGLLSLGVALLVVELTGEGLFKFMLKLFGIAAAPIGIPMLLGLISRRVTNRGALAGFGAGISVGLLLFFIVPEETNWLDVCWEQESVLFFGTAVVTLLTMIGVSVAVPMSAAEQSRIEAFHRRLETPIGQMAEDLPAAVPGEVVVSPFRVVGICVIAIGLMMLTVLPWISGALALGLNASLGLLLVLFGALMAWRSRWAQG
jgi:solute:Na+ symporter, SSS family